MAPHPATRLGLASALVAGCAVGAPVDPLATDDDSQIVGGYAIPIAEAPWQVSLQDELGHFCGGAIVDPGWVVTAQHCVQGAGRVTVVAGVDHLSQSSAGQRRGVAEVVRYPGFTDPTRGKDVALLALAEPLDLGAEVAAIALLGDDELSRTAPGTLAVVSGWGSLATGGPSPDDLRAVELPIVSNDVAQAAYSEETITDDQLAAGTDEGGKDSCQGDSGGPLTVGGGADVALAGIVSWGYGCADPGVPGMYARVTAYSGWIAEQIDGESPPPPPPPPGGLVINEILADPPAGYDANRDGTASTRTDEFIELVNAGDAVLDLSNAAIADGTGVRGRLPAGTTLAPGAALLVFGGGSPRGLPVATFDFELGLNNDGDTLRVTAADGTVLASAVYGADGGDDQSLVRQDEGTDSPFVKHRTLAPAAASPGTRADGTPF